MRTLKVLVDKLMFPEGPRWHDGQLFLSDMHAHKVIAIDSTGRVKTIVEAPNWPSGLGWLPDGRMLVVSMTDRKLMRLDRDGMKVHADLSALAAFHCNDMVVDAKGRAYVGNFGYNLYIDEPQKPANLVMVTPEGKASIAAEGLVFPNGTVITPDGKTLVVGESMGHRLTAFDIAPDGSLKNRRVWAELGEDVPDGIALDAESAIWVASPFSNSVLRVFEGGRVAERIKTDQLAIACAMGGSDRKTLFILTAPTIEPEKCQANPSAQVLTTQ
ncbi:MAG TPA: SMP-30/gluconolactonase/LRE family protein, partial [Candidatus Binataceae bacterium]|nr:SMP-30/gluconolactonase/LRE family protein [Candidatus Binataceae bacterium]